MMDSDSDKEKTEQRNENNVRNNQTCLEENSFSSSGSSSPITEDIDDYLPTDDNNETRSINQPRRLFDRQHLDLVRRRLFDSDSNNESDTNDSSQVNIAQKLTVSHSSDESSSPVTDDIDDYLPIARRRTTKTYHSKTLQWKEGHFDNQTSSDEEHTANVFENLNLNENVSTTTRYNNSDIDGHSEIDNRRPVIIVHSYNERRPNNRPRINQPRRLYDRKHLELVRQRLFDSCGSDESSSPVTDDIDDYLPITRTKKLCSSKSPQWKKAHLKNRKRNNKCRQIRRTRSADDKSSSSNESSKNNQERFQVWRAENPTESSSNISPQIVSTSKDSDNGAYNAESSDS